MSLHGVARRYAGALFDVARKQGSLDSARSSLAAVTAEIDAHEDLKKVLGSPAVPMPRKRAILDAVLAEMPGISVEVTRLLAALADRDRLGILSSINAGFEDRVLEDKRIVNADVVTAAPLGADRQKRLAEALGKAVGREVHVNARVDPSIIGGVIAKVGSVVFDGSVTRQLEKMKMQFVSDVQ
jgi:F-type H+-transporting ATPase subunit delta